MKSSTWFKSGKYAAGVSALAVSLSAGSALAQDETSLTIEEVVVTAQKRAESVQDVPVAIAAFDASFTKRMNLDDVKDLVKFTPGFAGDSKDSFIDYVNIRGISTNDFGVGGDPSVGFFQNGLYQGRNGVVVSSMFDLERAEVLRGPQGFLFGKNAISGALNIHTARPNFDSTSGYFELGLGERGIFEVEGAVNVPLSEMFALRVAAYHSEEDGYVKNLSYPDDDKQVAHDKTAMRATLGIKGENWDSTLMVQYEDRDQSGSVYRAHNGNGALDFLSDVLGKDIFPRGDVRDIDADEKLGSFDRGEILRLSAEINMDFDGFTVTSLTGYTDHTYEYAEDFDGMPVGFNDYAQDQEGDYFETELRVVSDTDSDLSWYAGVSYYKENIDAMFNNRGDEDVQCAAYYYMSCSDLWAYWEYGDFNYRPLGLEEKNLVEGKYSGWGAYLDLTYAVTDKFDLEAGVRYTKDKKKFGINVLPVESELGPWWMFGVYTDYWARDKQSWSDVTPRFIARYRPNEDWMVYASATRGYKSGGFGSFAVVADEDDITDDLQALNAVPNAFDPETVWSYEVGAKGDLLDGRIRTDITAYYYRFKDMQLNYFYQGTKVVNVGKVKSYGVEATLQAILSENFDVFFAASFNENEISDADATLPDGEVINLGPDGNRLSGSPKWTLAGVLNYHVPVSDTAEVNASLDFRTQTKIYGGLENLERGAQVGWQDVSLRVGYDEEAGNWSLTAYVENLFDEKYFDGYSEGETPFPGHGFGISRPRTFGVKFTKRFGE
ncbi:TonB-dependent receptor [Kordiimonas sediminis]|uniref:TonB-dependent receptor n=1 Tax=Kordiimonas sediminis TaxID=1735581 RepID=A0A919E8V3_9PROT|nr:TonB-dependent receptor [Kordiimonas sediminis]GHF26187.1 TonB-dependent receptor [Kordiimonas sediminis]